MVVRQAVKADPMYTNLLLLHGLFRWLMLAALLYSLYRAAGGYFAGRAFTRTDNLLRHWTATVAHIQLMLGCAVYFTSPVIAYFRGHFREAVQQKEMAFFGLIHMLLMLTAITFITIGSALAKRKTANRDKFRVMLLWFLLALLIILVAVPWPFSPLARRPYFRNL